MSKKMTKKSLLSLYDQMVAANRTLLDRKGEDYNGDQDRLKCFKAVEIIGVDPCSNIMARMLEKIARVARLLKYNKEVKSENIEDTIKDLMNYSFLLYALYKELND